MRIALLALALPACPGIIGTPTPTPTPRPVSKAVTVDWMPPETMEDGTPLRCPPRYRVWREGPDDVEVYLGETSELFLRVGDLEPGEHTFWVHTFCDGRPESSASNRVTVTLGN